MSWQMALLRISLCAGVLALALRELLGGGGVLPVLLATGVIVILISGQRLPHPEILVFVLGTLFALALSLDAPSALAAELLILALILSLRRGSMLARDWCAYVPLFVLVLLASCLLMGHRSHLLRAFAALASAGAIAGLAAVMLFRCTMQAGGAS